MYTFTERNNQADVQKFLCRLADRAASKRFSERDERRDDSRTGYSMPVYIARWDGDCFSRDEATIALSRDISSQGIAVVVVGPFHAERLMLAFWVESRPHFALGAVQSDQPIGGGYRRLGIKLVELLEVGDHPCLEELLPLVERLAPVVHATSPNV